MPEQSTAITSVEKLENLQKELITMSQNLRELHNLMGTSLKGVNEKWKDHKYKEFEDSFKPSMMRVRELSDKYEKWAKEYLQKRIDILKEQNGVGFSS